MNSTNRGSSTVGSAADGGTRRRHLKEDAVNRSRVHHERGSIQRPSKQANTSRPSTSSVLSSATQQSTVSVGSNSTITPGSMDGEVYLPGYNTLRTRRKKSQRNKASTPPPTERDSAHADVFQYMRDAKSSSNEDDEHVRPSSAASSGSTESSSASSSGTQIDDAQSSTAGASQYGSESPMTSPASTRKSNNAEFYQPGREYRSTRKPLYASSFVHGHGEVEHDEEDEDDNDNDNDASQTGEETDEEEAATVASTAERKAQVNNVQVESESEAVSEDESEEEEDDSEIDSDDGPEEIQIDTAKYSQALSTALERLPPPRVPSTSSRKSDPHTRRLRQQERELANHVLQSPQPHKDFQFVEGASGTGHAQMPLYSPRAYSEASPGGFHATSAPVVGWPPMPPMAAPLPIGYSPHHSPEANHAYPMAVQPPPDGSVQHMAPPYLPHLTQPPHYQPQALGPDLSKTTVVGYELLADKLSEAPLGGSRVRKGSIVPMYRKFEHLNHRVLLHLQDEVCELEEELRYLDESIAQTSPLNEAGHAYPASRRGDARYGGDLHYRRTELLGRIFQKLGQYSKCGTVLFAWRGMIVGAAVQPCCCSPIIGT